VFNLASAALPLIALIGTFLARAKPAPARHLQRYLPEIAAPSSLL
jgi:hypothetical protein